MCFRTHAGQESPILYKKLYSLGNIASWPNLDPG